MKSMQMPLLHVKVRIFRGFTVEPSRATTSLKRPGPLFRLTDVEFSIVFNLRYVTTWHMVLLNSEQVHCKNRQNEIYSLAVIIVYTSITVFISSIYNYNIKRNPWEKDLDFQFSV